jgi:hypothetical protein
MFRIISHPATSTLACISLASIAVAARSTSQEESNIALSSDTHYRHRTLPIAISPSTHQPPSASPNKSSLKSSSSSNPKPSLWQYYFPSDASHFHPHLSSSHPIPIPAGPPTNPQERKGLLLHQTIAMKSNLLKLWCRQSKRYWSVVDSSRQQANKQVSRYERWGGVVVVSTARGERERLDFSSGRKERKEGGNMTTMS